MKKDSAILVQLERVLNPARRLRPDEKVAVKKSND